MNLGELRKQLIEWLNEIKQWSPASKQDWNDYIYTDEELWKYRNPDREPDADILDYWQKTPALHILLWTNNHEYHLICRGDYMGGFAGTRKPRAGENHQRGNDLPDGKFGKETFNAFIRGLIRYELIAKVIPDETCCIDG
jgi:hypothetical protein